MKIYQKIWGGPDSNDNPNQSLRLTTVNEGDTTTVIKKLGVQALPGTELILNNQQNLDFPVRVGNTGIYEFSFEDNIPLYQIEIPARSLQAIKKSKTYLIIDIFYEGIRIEGSNA